MRNIFLRLIVLAGLLVSVVGTVFADWEYTENTDAMTSKTVKVATLTSGNSLDLEFPYKGKNNGYLMIRQHPKSGLNVIFRIDKGQLQCSSFSGCGIVVRFDDAPPVKFKGTEPADHSTTVIFVNSEQRFVSSASKAKRILVQANIFHNGAPVLEFMSSKPLEWAVPPTKARSKPVAAPASPVAITKPPETTWPAVPRSVIEQK